MGWFSATILGLASVIGVGIFVSVGIAAGLTGAAVIGALVLAGVLSGCNSLNLAQLAVNHPVSGGIYEYGYRYLTPWLGFTGGWIYLLGKIAVAATAALGFAGYVLNTLGLNQDHTLLVLVAESAVFLLTFIILGGMTRSKVVALLTVSVTISSLLFLIIGGMVTLPKTGFQPLTFIEANPFTQVQHFLESVALLFVAYNGAARISMLGEEVTNPEQNIPRAIFTTLGTTVILYVAVAVVGLGCLGATAFGRAATEQAAPLQVVVEKFGIVGGSGLLSMGAITATLSVLLSVILGLSRMLLAMGRRGDMPKIIAQLTEKDATPIWAIVGVAIAIALLVLTGAVKTTWSFAAFGGLYRSVIVSLAALQLSEEERLYPRWVTWVSLSSGFFLAFWIEWQVWLIGFGLIGVGLIWHSVAKQSQRTPADPC
ncbi:MAG: APC family permease [Cyanobacteria bacterium P01_F01_bin.150]